MELQSRVLKEGGGLDGLNFFILNFNHFWHYLHHRHLRFGCIKYAPNIIASFIILVLFFGDHFLLSLGLFFGNSSEALLQGKVLISNGLFNLKIFSDSPPSGFNWPVSATWEKESAFSFPVDMFLLAQIKDLVFEHGPLHRRPHFGEVPKHGRVYHISPPDLALYHFSIYRIGKSLPVKDSRLNHQQLDLLIIFFSPHFIILWLLLVLFFGLLFFRLRAPLDQLFIEETWVALDTFSHIFHHAFVLDLGMPSLYYRVHRAEVLHEPFNFFPLYAEPLDSFPQHLVLFGSPLRLVISHFFLDYKSSDQERSPAQ